MIKCNFVYALFLTVTICTSCNGQGKTNILKENIKFESKEIVSSHGPNTMVRNVKKGRNGTILFAASRAGVFRYDGKSFINLTSKVGSHRFWDVLEDRRGNLWFASTDSGVYCYNGKSFQHFTIREGLASNRVMCIYEDKTGNIWFGTGGGVSRYDGRSFRNFTTKEGLSSNDITTIIEDSSGKLWLGTRGEACFYNGKTFTVFKNKDGKAFNNIWSIIEDKKGNIWLGGNGLWRYDGSTFTNISQKFIGNIYEDNKGNIWATGEENLYGMGWTFSRYDQNSLYNKKPAVTEILSIKKMLCGILEANDGSIWFGSMNGVYRYDGKNITDSEGKVVQEHPLFYNSF